MGTDTPQCKYKTFQLSLAITDHDMSYRAKQAVKYLNKENQTFKIWLKIRLRGRATDHANLIEPVFKRFIELCSGGAQQEGPLNQKNDLWMVLLRKSN